MMKVDVATVDAVRRRLAVEVPAGEVTAEIERAYADLRRTARVKGFRPGKAPRPVLEQLFGDQVRTEVFTKLIQSSYREALETQRVEPVGHPEIVTERAEPGEALRYSATVEVKPEIVVSGYAGLEVERPVRRISDEDVAQFLERVREAQTQLRPVADRADARSGDVALVDYEARIGQRTVGRADGRLVEVGVGSGPDAIGPRLVGAVVGQGVVFDIDYPDDHANRELAGQRVAVSVQIKSLALKEVPTLDDDFAKDHGECATLTELRERVRQRLEAEASYEGESAVRGAVVQQLLQAHPVEVPRAMVERRTASLVEEFMARLGPQRPPASRLEELRRKLETDLEPRAREQVQAGLILEAIARQERLEVADDALDAQVERIAEQAGGAGDRVRAVYQEAGMRDGLRGQMLQDRALDHVVAQARIRSVEVASGVAERR